MTLRLLKWVLVILIATALLALAYCSYTESPPIASLRLAGHPAVLVCAV